MRRRTSSALPKEDGVRRRRPAPRHRVAARVRGWTGGSPMLPAWPRRRWWHRQGFGRRCAAALIGKGALPLAGRGLSPRHRDSGPPHPGRRVHARGALRPHVGARVGGDALASRRGLARPGRALGAPPACALAWLPFSRTPVMDLPAWGGPGLGGVECSPDKPMVLTRIRSSQEKRTAVKPKILETERFMSMSRNEESSLPGIVSQASPRCRASLVLGLR